MKKDYFTQLTRAARWLLPPEEAREVLAEYRDILDAAQRRREPPPGPGRPRGGHAAGLPAEAVS